MKEKTPTPNPDKPVGYRSNGASRNQKKKIKSARKVAELALSFVEGTQRIRKGFLCDALCAFA